MIYKTNLKSCKVVYESNYGWMIFSISPKLIFLGYPAMLMCLRAVKWAA